MSEAWVVKFASTLVNYSREVISILEVSFVSGSTVYGRHQTVFDAELFVSPKIFVLPLGKD